MSREHPLSPHRIAIAAVVLLLTAIAFLAVRGPAWWQRQYYPLEYAGIIGVVSAEHGVDPYLVSALINAESGFDASEVSHAGAIGLMQVMPETAAEVAREWGLLSATDTQALLRPELNIDIGTRHLAALIERYGDPAVALAAYNAGEGSVDRWIEESGKSGVLAAAYPETRRYVRRVLQERDRYAALYPDAFGGTPASEGTDE
ncbi:MAG TPA: lytic transglycosylase domain-containing protein [Coriobacteriia bacterium]|nr:lytic transglycosylase domain-containing protein [Coriobacteriia bacterium]